MIAGIRCPECQLKLPLDGEDSAGRRWCPACGTFFLIDNTTGVITVFYEESAEPPQEEAASDAPEAVDDGDGPVAEGSSAPRGYVDTAAEDQRQAQAIREARVRWQLYLSLIFVSLGLGFGIVKAATDTDGHGKDILLRTLMLAPAAGVILGIVVGGLIFNDAPAFSRSWLFGSKPKAPDFDEIADRVKEGMIRRRPLPPPDPAAPTPETEPSERPNTTSNSKTPRTTSANEGPHDATTPAPSQAIVPDEQPPARGR
jgi:hypothetical protein